MRRVEGEGFVGNSSNEVREDVDVDDDDDDGDEDDSEEVEEERGRVVLLRRGMEP